MGLFGNLFRRATRAVTSTARSLGSKAASGARKLGAKASDALHLGQKLVNRGLKAASDVAQSAVSKLGLSDAIAAAADFTRSALSGVVNALPVELQGPVTKLYNASPVAGFINSSLLTADVLSGRKDLTEEEIARVFPAYNVARNSIIAADGLARGDKIAAKAAAKQAAMTMIREAAKAAL